MSERLTKDVTLYAADCLVALKTLDSNSVDSVCTDPPYHLTSIVKRFGAENAAPAKVGKTGAYARASAGFMGKVWDGGDIAFRPELWAEVLRVLKPGGHLVSFGGTRTYHRMACAVEDAGFEIRDAVQWLYGNGFPKSLNISKAIDKAAGVERQVVGRYESPEGTSGRSNHEGRIGTSTRIGGLPEITAPATDAAREWDGWATAFKPACELIVLARKPLSEKTVVENVLKWGTGALNIDACRVAGQWTGSSSRQTQDITGGNFAGGHGKGRANIRSSQHDQGRYPANVIHDGSDEVVGAFPDAPGQQFYVGPEHGDRPSRGIYGDFGARPPNEPRGDSGSAARFFYSAKADADDRLGSKHPTVKPVDLICYLARLVTPPRGLCLDPFAGTGTLGEACIREGFRAILIEREAEYQDDIRRRMRLAVSGPDERSRESIKAKHRDKPADHGPLFSEWDRMWTEPFNEAAE